MLACTSLKNFEFKPYLNTNTTWLPSSLLKIHSDLKGILLESGFICHLITRSLITLLTRGTQFTPICLLKVHATLAFDFFRQESYAALS